MKEFFESNSDLVVFIFVLLCVLVIYLFRRLQHNKMYWKIPEAHEVFKNSKLYIFTHEYKAETNNFIGSILVLTEVKKADLEEILLGRNIFLNRYSSFFGFYDESGNSAVEPKEGVIYKCSIENKKVHLVALPKEPEIKKPLK